MGPGRRESAHGSPPPAEVSPSVPAKPDGRFEAYLDKLGQVSMTWPDTFASSPDLSVKGYRNLQKLINDYGKDVVLEGLEWASYKKLVPQGSTAMPLMVAICKTIGDEHASKERRASEDEG